MKQREKIQLEYYHQPSLRGTLSLGANVLKDLTKQAKMVVDSPEVKRAKVILSFAKLGLLGDVTALYTITTTMFPLQNRGITINYGRQYHLRCPTHNTPLFATSDPYKVWCPLCMEFIELNYPFDNLSIQLKVH